MAQEAGGLNHKDRLNRMSPAAQRASLGDVLYDTINLANALRAAHNGLVAKLDLDAGVTDTNYTSLWGVGATTPAVVLPENR